MGARILVIEDNLANLDLMIYLLEAFGYSTVAARDGDSGLDAMRGETPDLVICDIQLPATDGYEVARRIKAEPALRQVPIVAVTAFAMVGDREKALAAGFDGYIPKPIFPESFVSQVEAFLRPEQRAVGMDRDDAPAAPSAAAVASARLGKKGSILAVDDSCANLAVLRSMLEPFGYEMIAVDNVNDALEMARTLRPDLIVSDLHMPKETGLDFIWAVKSDACLRHIPFILITSSSRDEERIELLDACTSAKVIIRPIEPEKLLAEVESSLREERRS
jgi:CheY-like chemotaxis protein